MTRYPAIAQKGALELALETECQWLKKAAGQFWKEFIMGAEFFIRANRGMEIKEVTGVLNANSQQIMRITEDLIKKFGFNTNMRNFLTTIAATATVIGSTFQISPVAILAFLTKECGRDMRLMDETYRKGGPFQLMGDNYMRQLSLNPDSEGVRYDTRLLKRFLAAAGIELDFRYVQNRIADYNFLRRNPFANMLGAALTVALIVKRTGDTFGSVYLHPDKWETIAKRYNASKRAGAYAAEYMDNFQLLTQSMPFTGWKPSLKVIRTD